MPFTDGPAKTWHSPQGETGVGRTVFNHCQIVGEVARSLIAALPQKLQTLLFPPGGELVAAAHDIGKVSPTFAKKILQACCQDLAQYPALQLVEPQLEKLWGGHAGVSQATLELLAVPEFIPLIVGQHHGASPQLVGKTGNAEAFGGEAWLTERKKLIQALKLALDSDWPRLHSESQARVLAGLVSVGDWIGSGGDRFFPSVWLFEFSERVAEKQ